MLAEMDNAVLLAIKLQEQGVTIHGVTECQDRVDGEIIVNDNISVAVASDGTYASITNQPAPGIFEFGVGHAVDDVAGIVADIRQSMGANK